MSAAAFKRWDLYPETADTRGRARISAGEALELAALARDVALGAACVFEILEHDRREADFNDGSPILGGFDAGRLGRLGIVALLMLEDKASSAGERWAAQCQDAVQAQADPGCA